MKGATLRLPVFFGPSLSLTFPKNLHCFLASASTSDLATGSATHGHQSLGGNSLGIETDQQLLDIYQALVASGRLQEDVAQRACIAKLAGLSGQLQGYSCAVRAFKALSTDYQVRNAPDPSRLAQRHHMPARSAQQLVQDRAPRGWPGIQGGLARRWLVNCGTGLHAELIYGRPGPHLNGTWLFVLFRGSVIHGERSSRPPQCRRQRSSERSRLSQVCSSCCLVCLKASALRDQRTFEGHSLQLASINT